MRILALETNVETLKRKFVAEGEQTVFVAHRHVMVFLVHVWWQTIVTAAVIAAIPFAAAQGWFSPFALMASACVWLLIYAYAIFLAYVEWKYNFIIVTTQKVMLIEQRSLFYQEVSPLHFNAIRNIRTKSQLFGFFRCGILYINLAVPEQGGKIIERSNPYLSKPEDIAAIIENGLITNRKPLEGHVEEKKKEVMQKPVVTEENPEPDKLPEQQKKE